MPQFGGLNPQTLESNLDFAYLFALSARRRAKSVARAFLFRAWAHSPGAGHKRLRFLSLSGQSAKVASSNLYFAI